MGGITPEKLINNAIDQAKKVMLEPFLYVNRQCLVPNTVCSVCLSSALCVEICLIGEFMARFFTYSMYGLSWHSLRRVREGFPRRGLDSVTFLLSGEHPA